MLNLAYPRKTKVKKCVEFFSVFSSSSSLLWYSINDTTVQTHTYTDTNSLWRLSIKTIDQIPVCRWSVSYFTNFYIPCDFFLSNTQQEIANSAKKYTHTDREILINKQHTRSVKSVSVQSFNTKTPHSVTHCMAQHLIDKNEWSNKIKVFLKMYARCNHVKKICRKKNKLFTIN